MKRLKKEFFGNFQKNLNIIPNLIEIQLNTYDWFLQKDTTPQDRLNQGLKSVFTSVFPIISPDNNVILEFIEYYVGEPKYSEMDARMIGKSYSVPIKAKLRLIFRTTGEVREQDVFIGDLPLMTTRGTFIINGAERVVVNQIHRSPGVFFGYDDVHGVYSTKIIPDKGAWLEFEIDNKGFLIVRIDRKRKIVLGTFLKAIGLGTLDIYKIAEKGNASVTISLPGENAPKLPVGGKVLFVKNESELTEDNNSLYIISKKILSDPVKGKTVKVEFELGKTPYERSNKIDEIVKDYKDCKYISFNKIITIQESEQKSSEQKVHLYDLNQAILHTFYTSRKIGVIGKDKTVNKDSIIDALLGKYLAVSILNKAGDEVLLDVGEKITADIIEQIAFEEIPYVYVLDTDKYHDELVLIKSIVKDRENSVLMAIESIMNIIKPGDIINPKTVEKEFKNIFFEEDNYHLNEVGRFNINEKFRYQPPITTTALVIDDIVLTIDRIIRIYLQEAEPDDIDHLSNRRIRCMGELLTNQLKVAFARLERIIRERFTIQDPESFTPQSLISIKPVSSAINEFFGTSQLSQFMDQTNPLSELTHKRRLNALGPGGLTRERAGYEVRDVHYTHYGRMCPIETPEGPNIGLIVSLATMTKLNKYGFIMTPYRRVENGIVTSKIDYLTAAEEEVKIVAQANAPLRDDGSFKEKVVSARFKNNFQFVPAKTVDYMDVSPMQIFSVSASLIPFLEHDDANRALMGSNMQRQAVPLLKTEQPIIQTGMEAIAAFHSGVVVTAKRNGEVVDVEASRIVVKPEKPDNKNDLDIYEMDKFRRTNQGTCYNQKPIVNVKDKVKEGDVIADGPGVNGGELSLGKNVLVAFMPWEGYNYEDAILVSDKLLKDDTLTSVHIEEFDTMARDTKLGKEIITCDIPNLSEASLADLGEEGIIRIGAYVKPGNILVGK
ncbi:MAG: DNA-directed RNA polymerase subunit beta, partial [Spirochaetes bacterium]|nr:DNA-directed RNA polymerase subunit beta [Spirochaetota bacterium]